MFKENQLSLSCHSSAITYASHSFVTHVLMHEPLSFLLNIVYFVRDWRVEQPDQPTKTRYFLHVGRQTRSTNPTDRHVLCTSECQFCHDIRRHIYSSALLSLLAFFCCPQFALFPCSPHGQNLVPPTYTGAGIWTHVKRVASSYQGLELGISETDNFASIQSHIGSERTECHFLSINFSRKNGDTVGPLSFHSTVLRPFFRMHPHTHTHTIAGSLSHTLLYNYSHAYSLRQTVSSKFIAT